MEGSGSNLEFVSVSDVALLIYKSLILPLERVNTETAKIRKFGTSVMFADKTP